MKRVAVLQSNYVPWKGYFDLIAAVDEFILYDDAQFTKNDWRNRNRIKTPQGVQWLSVPVGQRIDRRIRDVVLDDPRWQASHWKTLECNYRRAPCFDEVAAWLAPIYLGQRHATLSDLNRTLIEAACAYLGIGTRITTSADYRLSEGRSQRVLDLCVQAGANEYLSGPAARDYLEEPLFAGRGIAVRWFAYDGYPEHPQLWGPFEHAVSIVDPLFNCGRDTRRYMKCGASTARQR